MNKKIIIIGAGPSAIAAATKLKSNGFTNIMLLEAENRIGGRVHTISYGKNVLDMGAQWCHGVKDNVVYDMAKDKNLLSADVPTYKDYHFVWSNGEEVPSDLAEKISALGWDILEGDTYQEEKSHFNGSLGNFFAEKYNQSMMKDEFKDVSEELKKQSYEFFHKIENTIEASDEWYQTSCRSLFEYWECEGGNLHWKDNGYGTVLNLLQNKHPSITDPNKVIDIIPNVHLNKEVKKIIYNKPNTAASPIRIECTDGFVYAADHVICTVSLGVLKEKHLSMFDPILPDWKINSIDGMMIGTVDKIYLEFETPFWDENWECYCFLWKPEHLKIVREDPVNGDWLEGLLGFFRVSCQPNILCGWITGSLAKIMEQKSDADVKAGAEKILRMFLNTKNIPDAKSMIRSKWYSNPHFRGSYTNYTLKSDALGATTSKLAEPIKDVNGQLAIQFAGEATDLHYFSTVHGAIGSGWREAQRLIDFYRPKSHL